jgi:hypothetical protein
MSDEKNSGVDPRFDPAFQRGFDPTVPIEESVPPPVSRKLAAIAPTPVAAPVVATTPASATAPEPSPTPKHEVVDESEAQAADEPQADGTVEVSPSRNPFLLFLGIIAVALVATGIWLFVRSGDAFNSKVVRSQGDYMSLTATIDIAPFIALLGAATAIGVLFVFAAKYRGRRPR